MRNGEGEGGQELTCPLKFSSVSAREQQKKEVSPDAVHMWSNISGVEGAERLTEKGDVEEEG